MNAKPQHQPKPQVTSSDRVVMLLSLVGYLRERDGVPVSEVAERFAISADEVRELMTFLGTAGVPGETQRYQHEDLFDIDWDALEFRDEARLTQVIAVDDAPRFAPGETAALIAGLHALTPMLPEGDAARAEDLARKLSGALGGPASALSLQQEAADPRIAMIVDALRDGRRLSFAYRDAEGVSTEREARPIRLSQDNDAWYLRGFCLTRQAERSFRVAQMTALTLGEVEPARESDPEPPQAPEAVESLETVEAPEAVSVYELIVTVPADSLSALAGFSPRVIEESEPGRLRVAIDAWNGALALQLMRIAPGRIVVEAPAHARVSVHDWASRALAAYDA